MFNANGKRKKILIFKKNIMAAVTVISEIEATFKVHLVLSEAEAIALKLIVSYDTKTFREWFERNMGKHYLKQEGAGLESLFATCKQELTFRLHDIKEIKKHIHEYKLKK